MRTIRWRNGQCPGRNGQWAERIAHAGSEAVRLVPFSSLPAVILDYLLSECCVSAWRLPLCRDAVRITALSLSLLTADEKSIPDEILGKEGYKRLGQAYVAELEIANMQ